MAPGNARRYNKTEMYADKTRSLNQSLHRFAALAGVLFALAAGAFGQTISRDTLTAKTPDQATKSSRFTPAQIKDEVSIDQKLNNQLPLDLPFSDDAGRRVTVGEALGGKPTILVMLQYRCPMLCGLMMDGLNRALRDLKFTAGREFNVVVVSIDPQEGQREATIKKNEYTQLYARPGSENGWHFLTGTEPNIARLADAAGFRFKHDPQTGAYIHASGIMVVTPKGHMARYFYGIEYPARILRLSLVEAGENKIGTLADKVTLFCYMYDPLQGKYGLAITRLTKVMGSATVLILASYMLVSFRRDRNRPLRVATSPNKAA